MERPKYIRGVPGRGAELLEYFKSKGYICNGYAGNTLDNPHILFLVHNNNLSHTSSTCFTGEMLMEFGEELSIDDLIPFKFNIGDKVTLFLPAMNIKKTSVVRERHYQNGVPYYKLRDDGRRGTFHLPEVQISSDPNDSFSTAYLNIVNDTAPSQPTGFRFKEGDKVKIFNRGNKVYTVLNCNKSGERITYDLLSPSAEFFTAAENDLELHDDSNIEHPPDNTPSESEKPYKYQIGDNVLAKDTWSLEYTPYKIIEQTTFLNLPAYIIEKDNGKTSIEYERDIYPIFKFNIGDWVIMQGYGSTSIHKILGHEYNNNNDAVYSLSYQNNEHAVCYTNVYEGLLRLAPAFKYKDDDKIFGRLIRPKTQYQTFTILSRTVKASNLPYYMIKWENGQITTEDEDNIENLLPPKTPHKFSIGDVIPYKGSWDNEPKAYRVTRQLKDSADNLFYELEDIEGNKAHSVPESRLPEAKFKFNVGDWVEHRKSWNSWKTSKCKIIKRHLNNQGSVFYDLSKTEDFDSTYIPEFKIYPIRPFKYNVGDKIYGKFRNTPLINTQNLLIVEQIIRNEEYAYNIQLESGLLIEKLESDIEKCDPNT